MKIVVPGPKRIANLAKHGLDMEDFEVRFSWDRFLARPARPSRTGRARFMLVGRLDGIAVTAIVSPLGSEALAIVSLRPASAHERAAYDAED